LLTSNFAFGETPVDDITTSEIADAIDRIERPGERSHAYVVLKVFFNWSLEREYCSANPIAVIRRPKVPSANERVSNDDELAAVWPTTNGKGCGIERPHRHHGYQAARKAARQCRK